MTGIILLLVSFCSQKYFRNILDMIFKVKNRKIKNISTAGKII
jgi:hypothetical protein